MYCPAHCAYAVKTIMLLLLLLLLLLKAKMTERACGTFMNKTMRAAAAAGGLAHNCCWNAAAASVAVHAPCNDSSCETTTGAAINGIASSLHMLTVMPTHLSTPEAYGSHVVAEAHHHHPDASHTDTDSPPSIQSHL